MGKFIKNIILICSLIPSITLANQIELYYDGFWSHHRAPISTERLVESHELFFKINETSIPDNINKYLFDNYSLNESNIKPVDFDFIIYLKNVDTEGNVIREIGGNNDVLYDFSSHLYKKLTEHEKNMVNNFIKDVSCMKSDFLSYKKVKSK